ncbi:MAG: T9SS type A sorting domain-containing protein [Bacteroidota bacterium]|nr:T9SS type A sorting domain-containing protein [Bacteroidota bacterium]
MKLNLYPISGFVVPLLLLQLIFTNKLDAQDCSGLTATYSAIESRCTATGALQINASGGSGTYNYKLTGTITTDFTSSSLITGLTPGTYNIIVKDIVSGCTYEMDNIIIPGSYSDPRFGITETDVSCVNGTDGTVSVAAIQNGRGPFLFTLVSPSPMSVGTSNATGVFTGLIPGSYSVQLTDSCGGIQTRNISIQNYTWSIASAPVTQPACNSFQAVINLTDSKGNNNNSGTAFNGFQYGVVNNTGDTSWFTTNTFSFDPGQKRTLTLVSKDRCGNVQFKNWTNGNIPSVAANATITAPTCTGFNAAITGMQNLTNPSYCLVDNLGNPVTGQSCNATGSFSNIPYGSYCIKITNTCYDTVISRCFTQSRAIPAVTGSVAISNYTCTDVTATVTGQQNLTSPQYCLFDNLGNAVGACNATGIFNHVPYGAYSIKVTDGCTGAIFTVNFTASRRLRSVGASVTINGYTCTTFTATVNGQSNLITPQYCLVDHLGNPVTCNSTGIFPGLAFGSYCINVTDACGDTSIQRCFTATQPPPTVGTPTISNKTCTGFTVTVTGQANVYNGQYCLLDKVTGNPVTGVPCNSTGVFTNIPYGDYCVQITDGCSGAVILSCVNVTAPVPSVGPVVTSNLTCAGFTAKVSNQQNLTNPSFCLYDNLNNQIGTCNNTGIFNISGFGSYYIKTTDGCAGAVFTSNFTVTKPIASVGSTVNFTNQGCTTFSATINGQVNLTAATYYLKSSSGTVISNNTSGVFDNLPYGSYCIDVQNSCMDTTIERCFTVAASATAMTVTATPSCAYNASDLNVHITSGFSPYVVTVYDTLNNLIKSVSSASNNLVISQIPALIPGQKYKVVVTGTCGTPATQYVLAQQSGLTHNYTITPKCPSSITPNGSSDLLVVASTNLTGVNLSVTQKDFAPVSIGYSFNSGNNFTFSNLEDAVYVITYSFTGCSTTLNDTVTLPNYTFPNLARSAAYQCDNNSFSVGASVSGGVYPFTYQVIGSIPSTPSIVSAPQSNPVFSIGNGVPYSLVRLRAIDACGNAGLNDVSILPLANTLVTATSNCIYQNITLSTNVIPNATYIWYKKLTAASTDSILVGTDPTYNVPYLTPADTGIYVNRMSINSGCLTKLSYFHLDGMCGGLWVLPQSVTLKGHALNETASQLTWDAPGSPDGITYQIERKNESGDFVSIGSISGNPGSGSYNFIDNSPGSGVNLYRLKISGTDNKFTYSNIVQINLKTTDRISVYPNPVGNVLNVNIQSGQTSRYQIVLFNVAGQILYASSPASVQNSTLIYHRDDSVVPGLYMLKVKNLSNGESSTYKLLFGER